MLPIQHGHKTHLDAIRGNVAGSDLMLSAFISALQHFKRATVALPFPADTFSTSSKEKDFERVRRACEGIPPMRDLAEASCSSDLPRDSRALLDWLLVPMTRTVPQFRHISMAELRGQLQWAHGNIKFDPAPTFVFENVSNYAKGFDEPLLAFHVSPK